MGAVLFLTALVFVSSESFSPHSHYEIVSQFGGFGPTLPSSKMSADWTKPIRVISSHTEICSCNTGVSQSFSWTQGLDTVLL